MWETRGLVAGTEDKELWLLVLPVPDEDLHGWLFPLRYAARGTRDWSWLLFTAHAITTVHHHKTKDAALAAAES